jgi:hypothetical protein
MTCVVLINLVWSSIHNLIKVFPDICASTTLYTRSQFLTGIPPFKPCAMQETLTRMKKFSKDAYMKGQANNAQNTFESNARQ